MPKYLKYIVLLLAFVLIAGCINVSEDIVLKLDGSGSLLLSYSIPEALMKDQQSLHNAMIQTGIVFPLTKQDFMKQFAGLKGIDVRYAKTSADNGYYRIAGKVKFKNIGDLQMNNIRFVLKNSGKNKELEISLLNSMNKNHATAEPRSRINYEEMLKGSLKNYGITITVSFPTEVLSANGNIKNRSVRWDVPMKVFLQSEAKAMELKAVYSGHPTLWDRIKDFFR